MLHRAVHPVGRFRGISATQIAAVERGGADLIHVDMMDGHFVPEHHDGAGRRRGDRRATRLPLDVHLMVEEPDRFLDRRSSRRARRPLRCTSRCFPTCTGRSRRSSELGSKAGVALNPATPVATLEDDCARPGLRAGDVGEPGVLGSDFHPAERV